MDRLTDRISQGLQQQTTQIQNMLACKGAIDIAEAQALCTDMEIIRGLLQSLQERVLQCARHHLKADIGKH